MSHSQIHNVYSYNHAAQRKKVVARYKVSRSRPHGRPRNVGRVTRVTKLQLKGE